MTRDELLGRARSGFEARFGYVPHALGYAPGRVELLGNHTDYNEGFVLTAAIDRAVVVAGAAREVPEARLVSESFGEVRFDPARPESQPDAKWADYFLGVVDQLNKAGARIGGFDAFLTSSVPGGAGVSSSAAVLVGAAQLLLSLYPHVIGMDAMGLARLCRAAENEFVGAPVGILDQFSSLFGRAGHALFLDCRTYDWKAVALPGERCRILIADTGVKHALASGGGYSERRAQCEQAARVLTEGASDKLRDVSWEVLEARASDLDPVLLKRARHVIGENKRVEWGVEALQSGNLSAFGEMVNNTHESCRDLFENSCSEVDNLVEISQKHTGVWGAKLTGGGWGGCAVIFHTPEAEESLCAALTEGFSKKFGHAPTLIPTYAAPGAEAIQVR
jgi:galactokinase